MDLKMPEQPTLLFEIGMEELPPKALPKLRDALCAGCIQGLRDAQMEPERAQAFATPRRLALLLEGVPERQPDRIEERRGPAVTAAFDALGHPTRAAEGFARSCGVTVAELGREHTDRGEYLVYRESKSGQNLETVLQGVLTNALAALPAPKRMRWGDGDVEFIRPVHWLVALYGDQVLNIELLGLRSGRETFGHRFHHPEAIVLNHAGEYVEKLASSGMVQVDFELRRRNIREQIEHEAERASSRALIDPDLLDEVTSLVEWPVVLTGSFDPRFLDVPQEALISTMQDNQKYFPLVDAAGKLLSRFIVVSNIRSLSPDAVRDGNERVLRPRFADAEFFWQQDRQQPLASREPWLATVVFEQRLGTLGDKARRLTRLMRYLAAAMNLDPELAERAARLAKCDLGTRMVFEFTELQGTMGRYYAQQDGESEVLAAALEQHYWPRQAGAELPESPLAQALALADRLDTLVGIFAIGKEPSGTRDPFALRRAALGILRILIEREIPLALTPLLIEAAEALRERVSEAPGVVPRVREYILERLRGYLLEQGMPPEVFEAVAALEIDPPLDFVTRARAVQYFRSLPEAEALAAANKRIGNLLRRSDEIAGKPVATELLQQPAEQVLLAALEEVEPEIEAALARGDYIDCLNRLARLRGPVDDFFDDVMVMAEDPALRDNRLALLHRLAMRMRSVADLGRLATG
jgi:glycyl-tRNA synthetase beta chain